MDKDNAKKFDELYKLLSAGKTHKEVYDFDSGLLNDIFEDLTGNAEERYDKICTKLSRVLSRLIRHYKDSDDKPDIIAKIQRFLDSSILPSAGPNIEDYQQREGRIINIKREDSKISFSCTDETYNKTIERIEKEQFILLINQAKSLYSEAIAYLEDIVWHRKDDVEIDPSWKKKTPTAT